VLAGFTVVAVLGFPVGIPVAVLVVVLVPRALSRLEPAALRRERARELRDVPLTAELLAAALAAGCPLRDAIAVTVEVLDGRLAARLALALGELRLGGASESAWLPAFASAPESVREVAAVLGEAELRGIAPIPQLRALAERQRRAAATGAAAHAHRVGVWSVGPLGLCFLPAFVLVGVLPLVAAAVHLLKF
jgi:pilus assembly protein TadC